MVNSLQRVDRKNLDRAGILSSGEVDGVLRAKTLKFIKDNTVDGDPPWLIDVFAYAVSLKQDLSLSRKGKGYELLKKIMIRELSRRERRSEEKKEKVDLSA